MITLDVKKNLENNVYSIEIAVTEIPETDKELFNDFGDIEINTGGTIKITTIEDGKSTESEVTLPQGFRRFPSQFPIFNKFSKVNYNGKEKAVATAWEQHIQTQIEKKMNELRSNIDDFSGTDQLKV
ncbi:hypothetical protein EEL31_10400 [Brevibacillus laterosporus]|nr:hypothetical protein [Brevibacillus laterosporus]TPG68899.1 hypothetical protein EEL31_10400 [Brevibacillus laterosporus]